MGRSTSDPDEATLPLECLATELAISEKDVTEHGVLLVLMANPQTEISLSALKVSLNKKGHLQFATAVNGAVIQNAKTIRLTLTRDNPDDDFRGWQFQAVEQFREEPPKY